MRVRGAGWRFKLTFAHHFASKKKNAAKIRPELRLSKISEEKLNLKKKREKFPTKTRTKKYARARGRLAF